MPRNMKSTEEDISLTDGKVVSQKGGIQVIKYSNGDYDRVFRYVDVDTKKEVLRTMKQQKEGLSKILEIDRNYWDQVVDEVNVGDSEFDLERSYIVTVLTEDRLIEFITEEEDERW